LDDKEVESLCKVVRKPVGTSNTTGTVVSLRAEANLKMAVYYLKYLERTSRPTDANNITLNTVRSLRTYKQWEMENKDVTAPTISMKDWPKTIQSLVEYLKGCLGVTKLPLSYVIRDEANVFPAPLGGYTTRQQGLIARAPILAVGSARLINPLTQTYLDDSSKVWELLSAITRDLECWSYVMPAQKTREGRSAFFNLKLHYLGVNNVDNMASTAERKLQTNSYTGETRKWNFEKYVRVHVDQHAILNGLREHGYSGIDKRTMVRYLNAGIKTTSLDHVKTRILSDASLRENFSACVNIFQDFITQKEVESPNVTIAAIHDTQPRNEHKGKYKKYNNSHKTGGNEEATDRYYKYQEWKTLSPDKRKAVMALRKKRGNAHKKARQDKQEEEYQKIAAIVVASLSAGASRSTENETLPEEEVVDNRNNKALRRK